MGNFNRGGRSGGGGGRDFGGGRGGFNDRGDRPRPEMHKAICSKCGKECEVPFRPTGSKPVFCRDCFRENGGGAEPRRFDDRGGRPQRQDDNRQQASGPSYNDQFKAINTKLDEIMRILASSQKPAKKEKALDIPVQEIVEVEEELTPVVKKPKKEKLPKAEEIVLTPEPTEA